MSLCSLKKSRPTAKPSTAISVEDFIDDAQAYAQGLSQRPCATITPIHRLQPAPIATKPMKKRTFTLTERCIDNLDQLSQQTGIAKSRIIRILVNHASTNALLDIIHTSETI